MEKRELFDALENFSQNLMVTLAEVEAIKQQLQKLMEENTSLRLENEKLRERLSQLETAPETKPLQHQKSSLEGVYADGFHVCNVFYGQRRHNDEDCAWCLELIYRD